MVVSDEEEEEEEFLDVEEPVSGAAQTATGDVATSAHVAAKAELDRDLLDFSAVAGQVTTPHGRASTVTAMSAASASWVEEMNAELAEFDAMTASVDYVSPSSGWETRMETELQQKMATPQR